MQDLKKVAVFGLGKLGACLAATLASRGLEVIGIDIDENKVRQINAGLAPVEEPLLSETIRDAGRRLSASSKSADAATAQASFFITPTPSENDGAFTNRFLLAALLPFAKALHAAKQTGHLFIISSTTTPGSIEREIIPALERELEGRCGTDFHLCYNPEFIALGDVVHGLLAPDMVLIGESDPIAGDRLEKWYRSYTTNHAPVHRMSIASAELAKISLNSYVTMKISFTNQLRMIAQAIPGADINAVLGAVGSDSRVGKKYLRPGLSYGGPCFPRDNRLVAYVAKSLGLHAPMAEASDRVNQLTHENLLSQVLKSTIQTDRVAILGFAYKPLTHIVEESPGLILARGLAKHGYSVLAHDFNASPENQPELKALPLIWHSELAKLIAANPTIAVICSPDSRYQSLAERTNVRWIDPWEILRSNRSKSH